MFSRGSPFARAVRILLHELGLAYDGHEPDDSPAEIQLGTVTPTMQVPTLRDGDVTLWESGLIAEYLMTRYTHRPQDDRPLALVPWRPEFLWKDKLLFSTIQTFGTAVTTISQMTWTGVHVDGNPHLRRCAQRMTLILGWLEEELALADGGGFFPNCVSMQDIFLICHIRFVQARPLGITFDLSRHEKISILADELDRRSSFRSNRILWWDPDVLDYAPDGTPIY
ncbi:glutathione S-transferase family protein [Silicimonas algicola]|nr:glutathione S-transferase N-terminal domain-containing protein [Silicimonas algicola]